MMVLIPDATGLLYYLYIEFGNWWIQGLESPVIVALAAAAVTFRCGSE